MVVYAVLWIAFMIHAVATRSISKYEANVLDVQIYLKQYGYLSENKASSHDEIREALARFQKFMGLDQTGEVDPATVSVMEMPRCGLKDVEDGSEGGRQKRFALIGGKWQTKDLVFGIVDDEYPDGLDRDGVDAVLREAFNYWQDVSGLTFREITQEEADDEYRNLNIGIRFAKAYHGDLSPFDGRGGVLAHAFFPRYGGMVHFDKDERWSLGSRNINLKQIAVHEIGHSLGLGHSDVMGSVMWPAYFGYTPSFRMHADDIEGIQLLYGPPLSDEDDDGDSDDDSDDATDRDSDDATDGDSDDGTDGDSDDGTDGDSNDGTDGDSDGAIVSSLNLRMGNLNEPANLDSEGDNEDSPMADSEPVSKGQSLRASAMHLMLIFTIIWLCIF